MWTTNDYKRGLLLASASTCTMIFVVLSQAMAQVTTGPAPQSSEAAAAAPRLVKQAGINKGPEEIVVTARKRNEKLLDVPVSITAFTSKALQTRGIYSITDLADQTPGLTVDGTVSGSGRNDRSFPEYVIRGIVPSLSTNPTTTVFLDGAPLISGQVNDLEDLDRVEVLKGPQSAYFGRETFAGAISLVTKDPSNTPTASIDALVASPNYYDEHISLEGPIVADKLWALGSYRFYSRQGSYDNEAVADKTSDHLGDQSTQAANFEIVAKPIDNLKVKLLGLYWHDDDGPSAQALILPSQTDRTDPAVNGGLPFWFDGVVPDRLSSQPAANDLVTPAVGALLHHLGTPAGLQLFAPLKNSYGLARDAYHGSMNVDYYVESLGVTLTSLTAIDNQKFSELQDLANDDGSKYPNPAYAAGQPYANSYLDFPFFIEDAFRSVSQEVRLTSDQDERFRYLIGANYEFTRLDQSLGGGSGFDFFVGDAPDTSKTYGLFWGFAFDVLKNLTVNFEGRYQADDEATSPVVGPKIEVIYRNFLPRVSIQYKPTSRTMAYVTYSEGVNPSTFNGFIPGLPAAEQAYLKTNFGASVEVKPEQLSNYEAGVKGRFLGNTLTVSADVYYDQWFRQINSSTVDYFVGPTLEQTAAFINNGKTDLDGVEGEVDWEPIDGLTFNASGAINNTKIKHGGCYTCLEQTGTTDVNGSQLPNVSKYSATLGAQYNGRLGMLEGTFLSHFADWGYFARGDYVYKSGQYEDRDDLVRTPVENLLNLRVGITHDTLTVEGFVDNLTNWGGPTSLAPIVDLGNPAETYAHNDDSLVAGLPFLRTYGLRLRYKFGLPPAPTPEASPPPQPVAAIPSAPPARTYLVFFDWDRADLSSRARQIVANAAANSQGGRITKVQVDGYTDLSGTVPYNQKLSVRRAESVKAELVRDGVPANEIGITGHGESNPLVLTAPGVREPQNRRVEIILL